MEVMMLEIILSLIFTFALAQSNIQTANEIREAENTIPIEKKVVQTVKVEKEKEAVKIKPKALTAESKKEELIPDDTWETYTITAYENGVKSTGKRPGDKGYSITKSGEKTVEGITAAGDLSKLPIGTVVYIETLGYRTILDSGSKVKGNHIDVFMESYDECMEFGRQKLRVKIVEMGVKD